jgi:acyl carrier protein
MTAPTTLDRLAVLDMVIESVQSILATSNAPDGADVTEETRLFGQTAILDSMGLVNLIVEVEQNLEDEYDVTVVLADERAMSQKHSPFRSVGSLVDYICRIAVEAA